MRTLIGAGCFWTVEAIVTSLRGITQTQCGYIYMTQGWPSVESTQRHGPERMEVVAFDWDPAILSAAELMEVILATSQPNMISWDMPGELAHVRHGIFVDPGVHSDMEQGLVAAGMAPSTCQFKILPLPKRFKAAGEYDQAFYTKRPADSYCTSIVVPKMATLRTRFAHLLKSTH